MYWYKSRSLTPSPSPKGRGFLCIVVLALVLIASCRPDVKEAKGTQQYFDIKGFFKADSARLSKVGLITKTVTHNAITETKKIHIDNWGREFELFTNSDINRPAWRESYSVSKGDNVIIYQAKTPELKTRRIVIGKTGDKVKWILILNHTKNLLYENSERLSYFPDSLYQITKTQKVRVMSKNTYTVKGVFK